MLVKEPGRKSFNLMLYSINKSKFFQNMFKKKQDIIFSVYSDVSSQKYSVNGKEGDNLLDTINEFLYNEGVCNKQLACHSCAVHVTKLYENLNKPSQEEQDVHCELGDLYKENCTRMSCQITLNRNLNGMEVEIPRSAFFIFNQKEDKMN